MPRRRHTTSGFTLVEILVVIGIIALLIAILLPVISRARESGHRVKCLSNLRSMAQAAFMHANEHKGYMPIAGYMPHERGNSGSDIPWPIFLQDENRVKYIYLFDYGDIPRGWDPAPLTIALGQYMGVPLDWGRNNVFHGSERTAASITLKSPELQRLFTCPSDRSDREGGWSINDSDGWSRELGWEYSSYIFNGMALSYSQTVEGGWCPAGKVNRILRPAEVLLFADGKLASYDLSFGGRVMHDQNPAGFAIQWNVRTNDDTLYDYAIHGQNSFGTDGWGIFDHQRHRNKMNVVFFDGHAETAEMTRLDRHGNVTGPGDFERIGVTRGIALQ